MAGTTPHYGLPYPGADDTVADSQPVVASLVQTIEQKIMSALTVTDRLNTAGSTEQTWIVPEGITSVRVRVQGGGGGDNYTPGAVAGDLVEAVLDVSGMPSLKIRVGNPGEAKIADAAAGQGQNKGGWPGGGSAGAPTWNIYPGAFIQPGGGGGYSMIRSREGLDLVVAAGGQGGGGMDGSLNGGNATTSAGGAAGYSPNGSSSPSTPGGKYQGGNGAANNYVSGTQYHPGGGGGGGYYGGGGGGTANMPATFGSGGRGSSYTDPTRATSVTIGGGSAGAGYVEIIYAPAFTLPYPTADTLLTDTPAIWKTLAETIDTKIGEIP